MDELQMISELFEDLQNDESVDLGAYAERFVEVSEAKDGLITILTENGQATEASEATIAELKNANWELSKKITTKEPKAKEEDTEVEDEPEDETPYETNDEALAELFDKEEKEEEKEK